MSSSQGLILVKSDNLSVAWSKAFVQFAQPGVTEVVPLIVNVCGFANGFPPEDPTIRGELENALAARQAEHGTYLPETTANTIFPENLWRLYQKHGRNAFFAKYMELLPRLAKRDRRNTRGTYFSRMIDGPKGGQLGHVLDTWQTGHRRRSALQIVIFDPGKDHSDQPFLGFPCLDYITFTPDTTTNTLSVTALYATQYIFDRAYGNYLGLCQLGRFVATELGLRFSQLTCIASQAKIGDALPTKREVHALATSIEQAERGDAQVAAGST